MAVIGTIRDRMGWLLIGFVGLALVLFILEGLLSSNRSMFSSNDVAVVNGESVTVQEFEERVQKMVEDYKLRNNTDVVDNNLMDQMREQAWNIMINEMLFNKTYQKMGITVSSKELFDMVQGKNIHPQIRQAFTDPNTGQFNPANVVNFLKNLDQQDPKTKSQWLEFERSIVEDRINQKYNNLLNQSLYVTTAEAKQDFKDKNRVTRISYLLSPYSTIADSAVSVSEDEMKKYYNEHNYMYKLTDDARSIDYVVYAVEPSAEDVNAVQTEMNRLGEEFKTSTADSAFVMRNAETRMPARYYKKGSLGAALDSVVFKLPVGTVYGPYKEGNVIKLAKIEAAKSLPDSVKARHILLPIQGDVAKTKERADSIKKAIKAGAKFADLAIKFSADKGSAVKGGDLGTFAEGAMVPQFNDACFEGKKGDMPVVETQFGVHIIEIMDQKSPSARVKVAIVDKKLEPSSKTYQAEFAKANEFAVEANGGNFDAAVKSKKADKRSQDLRATDRNILGVDNSREIVRWAYNAKKNETSKVFEIADKYVIASLKEIKEKGIAPFEQVKQQVEVMAKREKKADILSEQLNKAIKAGKDMSTASFIAKLPLQTADYITFGGGGISGVGREPVVVGTLSTMKQGQTSQAIKGQAGVFVVKVESFIDQPAPKDYNQQKAMLANMVKQRAGFEMYNAIKDEADIDDNRIKFY